MIELFVILFIAFLVEIIGGYYKQGLDGIPISAIFVSLFILVNSFKGIQLFILVLIIGIVLFVFKEYIFNVYSRKDMKILNISSKTIFIFLLVLMTWFINNYLSNSILVFIVLSVALSYAYLFFIISLFENILREILKENIIKYVERESVNFSEDIIQEIVGEAYIFLRDKDIFPYKFLLFEFYLLILALILYYLIVLSVNFFNISNFNSIYLVYVLFLFFSFVVIFMRVFYNVTIVNIFDNYFKQYLNSLILKYKMEEINKELSSLQSTNNNLNNWLKFLKDFYSKLDDNPDYEDLYNSFYSIISKAFSFSKFVLFIPEKEDDIIGSMKPVFTRGIGRGEIYIKGTSVEVVINSLKSVYYFGGTVFSALSLFKDDRSFICSPIKISNKLIGVVYISSINTRNFTEQDVNFVELLCDKFAIMYILYREYSRTLDMAIKDGLTGLYTHRHFQELLSKEIDNAKLYGYPVCLLMIDTDKFKQYNDTFGHPAGDELLKNIAKNLKNMVKDKGFVCRYGGDEFSIILPNFYKEDAYLLAEEIRKSYVQFKRGDIQVSASIGVACFPIDASSKEEIIKLADELLYTAKKSGRNRVIVT